MLPANCPTGFCDCPDCEHFPEHQCNYPKTDRLLDEMEAKRKLAWDSEIAMAEVHSLREILFRTQRLTWERAIRLVRETL